MLHAPFCGVHAVASTPPDLSPRLLCRFFSCRRRCWVRAWTFPTFTLGRRPDCFLRSLKTALHSAREPGARSACTLAGRSCFNRLLSSSASRVPLRSTHPFAVAARRSQPAPGRDFHPLEPRAIIAHEKGQRKKERTAFGRGGRKGLTWRSGPRPANDGGRLPVPPAVLLPFSFALFPSFSRAG